MQRRKFISNLGFNLAAVCTACMAACTKSTANPPGTINFTIDLNNELLATGSSTVKNGVIVVRIAASNIPASFTAVQQACTHEGTPINYNATKGNFVCPLHGSEFSNNGTVLIGPAGENLKKYTITINGNSLTVTG